MVQAMALEDPTRDNNLSLRAWAMFPRAPKANGCRFSLDTFWSLQLDQHSFICLVNIAPKVLLKLAIIKL